MSNDPGPRLIQETLQIDPSLFAGTAIASTAPQPVGYQSVLDYSGLVAGQLETQSLLAGTAAVQYPGVTTPDISWSDVEDRATQLRLWGLESLAPFGLVHPDRKSSIYGYNYVRDEIIGDGGRDAVRDVAAEFQTEPNKFFPFELQPIDGGSSEIRWKGQYNLVNRGWSDLHLPSGEHPVEVTAVTDTSFTFRTAPGHFDPPGSTITFLLYSDAADKVHVLHRGVTAPTNDWSLKWLVAPLGAERTWTKQADNLRTWLAEHPRPSPP